MSCAQVSAAWPASEPASEEGEHDQHDDRRREHDLPLAVLGDAAAVAVATAAVLALLITLMLSERCRERPERFEELCWISRTARTSLLSLVDSRLTVASELRRGAMLGWVSLPLRSMVGTGPGWGRTAEGAASRAMSSGSWIRPLTAVGSSQLSGVVLALRPRGRRWRPEA